MATKLKYWPLPICQLWCPVVLGALLRQEREDPSVLLAGRAPRSRNRGVLESSCHCLAPTHSPLLGGGGWLEGFPSFHTVD